MKEINRENAVVQEWDKVYCELLQKILDEGVTCENRTEIDTISIEGAYFKLNVGENFPILESKKVAIYNALSEMLWIYQAQSNDVNWLHERHNKIWDEWMIDKDGIYRTYEVNGEYNPDKEVEVFDLDGNIIPGLKAQSKIPGKTIKSAKFFGKEWAETIGKDYGWINNTTQRPQDIQHTLKTDPTDRRMVISMWQDEYLKTAVLPPCVWSVEFTVKGGKLHAFVHQRSCDTPLGLPFNVAQYAILLSMFAKVANLEVGNLNWSIMDAHIYVNQIDGVKKQLERYKKMLKWEDYIKKHSDEEIINLYNELKNKIKIFKEKNLIDKIDKELKEDFTILELMLTKEKAILELADKDDFFKFDNHINNDKEYLKVNATGNEDIKVLKYKSAPFIKMPIAQ